MSAQEYPEFCDKALEPLKVPCCPELVKDDRCDRLDLKYKLKNEATVTVGDHPRTIVVEVTIHATVERCSGPLTLGDLVYTTTLLPGEKVRLVSSDRRSRFSYDAESKVSYRHTHLAEESFFMSSIARDMMDLQVSESGSGSRHDWGNWGANVDADYWSVAFAGGGSVDVNGRYDDQSTYEFGRSLSQHASSSHSRAVQSTRSYSSVSFGEVSSRTHIEGESEQHFEAASRVFSNPNRCHAVSFYFYRLNKLQETRFKITRITRTVLDPAATTDVNSNRPKRPTGVAVVPSGIVATAGNRLDVQNRAAQSTAVEFEAGHEARGAGFAAGTGTLLATSSRFAVETPAPLPRAVRAAAVQQVDERLVKAGILEAVGGKVSSQFVQELSWKQCSSVPTPGVLVKGCLDDCDICEPSLKEQIQLELQRQDLENQLLSKRIELLEKSQEYRCCPGEAEADGENDEN